MKRIIIIGSSFKEGRRIALDFGFDQNAYENFSKKMTALFELENKNISAATHTLETKTTNWDEVINLDPYFNNLEVLKDENEFINLLLNDDVLTSIDVANYILVKNKMTQTRLQKILYFIYADYLLKFNKKIFDDKISAFQYGPIINRIYDKYKNNNDSENDKLLSIDEKYKDALTARLLVGKEGLQKLNFINDELVKYQNLSTEELVALTHKDDTPWSKNYQPDQKFSQISDDDIIKYHKNEDMDLL